MDTGARKGGVILWTSPLAGRGFGAWAVRPRAAPRRPRTQTPPRGFDARHGSVAWGGTLQSISLFAAHG